MDNSNLYFKDVYPLLERIKRAQKSGYAVEFAREIKGGLAPNGDTVAGSTELNLTVGTQKWEKAMEETVLQKYVHPILNKQMHKCFVEDKYVLTVDNIAKILDVDNRYVQTHILLLVDHINVPLGTTTFWEGIRYLHSENKPGLTFWQSRYYKFKKVLISYSSFLHLLKEGLFLETEDDEGNKRRSQVKSVCEALIQEQLIAIPYIKRQTRRACSHKLLYRKTSIKELVIKEKLQKFRGSTINDYKKVYPTEPTPLSLWGVIPVDPEELYITNALLPEDIGVTVHQTEVEKYLIKQKKGSNELEHPHLRFVLKLDLAELYLYLFEELLPIDLDVFGHLFEVVRLVKEKKKN